MSTNELLERESGTRKSDVKSSIDHGEFGRREEMKKKKKKSWRDEWPSYASERIAGERGGGEKRARACNKSVQQAVYSRRRGGQ